MARPPPCSCAEVIRQLQDFVDHELDADWVRRIEAHLDACNPCAEEYRFEASVLEEVRRKVRAMAVPDHLRAKIFTTLRSLEREPPPTS